MRKTRSTTLLAAFAAGALLLGACSEDSDNGGGTADTGNGGGGAALSGKIFVSGSSTVEPISSLVAEAFSKANPGVTVSVDGPGTGDGFELFCSGETDVSDASRAIKDEEAQVCADNGIEYVELRVAIDGLSVITSTENDAVECLDFPALYALLGPESTNIATWDAANDLAAEVGSAYTDLPAAPLTVTAPGEESGTYDSFIELVLEDIADEREQDAVSRPDYTSSPNDNVIIEGIAGSSTSLGWVGYAFFLENQDTVKALAVAGEDGECVAPTPETIASAEYPIARDLFIYVNTGKAAENAALTAFIDAYMDEVGVQAVADSGYVSLTDDGWAETVAAWEGARPS